MASRAQWVSFLLLASPVMLCIGCEADDPSETETPDDGSSDTGIDDQVCSPAVTYTENLSACTTPVDYYQPRTNASTDDTWPACISDNDAWAMIGTSVSSIARTEAYDTMADALWLSTTPPTARDFTDMRILYEAEDGVGSRVLRRYDVHYSAPVTGSCTDAAIAAANSDYCVGPAKLTPMIVDAFAKGMQGADPVIQAARIQAALQWFFYVSVVKEATTCTSAKGDCDSSWAYYSGGTTRAAPIGLGADIQSYAPATHDAAYDGLLAVRCWRDLDSANTATDLATRDRAIAQLDKALLRGMTILVRERLLELDCTGGVYKTATLEWLKIIVPLLDRATRALSSATADYLLGELQKEADAVDVATAVAKLDALYPCP